MTNQIEAALRIAQKPISRAPERAKDAAANRVQQGANFDGGLIKSTGFGRTDTIPVNLPAGSYVLPADIVSALGQGNTDAGAKALDRDAAQVGFTPDGKRLDGKGATGVTRRVPIIAAGGEYVVHPAMVAHYGDGKMKDGHDNLDGFVKETRKKTHKMLGELPGPAQ